MEVLHIEAHGVRGAGVVVLWTVLVTKVVENSGLVQPGW